MRILVVSRHFRVNVGTMVHGVYKRFQMMLEAISDITQIDVLYYVPQTVDLSSDSVASVERALTDHFKVPLKLFLCPLADARGFFAKSLAYLKGAFCMVHQPVYAGTAGERQLRALKACLANQPDAVLVHRLAAMIPFFYLHDEMPPLFLDLDDIEHVAFRRRLPHLATISARIRNLALYPALCRGEKRAIQLARRTFVCSEADRDYLKSRWDSEGVVKISNAVEIPPPQEITTEPNLLFLGSFSYKPNVDAAEFLIRKIWPLISARMPSATLRIAGGDPQKISAYHTGVKGVEFTGFVKDLEALYRQTRVVCVPILSGSGTRVKILEAAAYGKPVVSTSIGAEGLDMRDNIDIMIRDEPQAIADACIILLHDHQKCKQLGIAARTTVSQNYDKKTVKQKIKETILQALTNRIVSIRETK